jgi:Zn-dependent alcohol dehydrogenase
MGYPDTFEGFVISDMKKWSDFSKKEIKPKQFNDNDVDIKIECCGVCGSDVHTITGGWGDAPMPICVGHEVIGRAVKVGSKVKSVSGHIHYLWCPVVHQHSLIPMYRSRSEIVSAVVLKSGLA